MDGFRCTLGGACVLELPTPTGRKLGENGFGWLNSLMDDPMPYA